VTGAQPSSIGLLSTYPPTQCGLATFTAALAEELVDARVVRVLENPAEHPGLTAGEPRLGPGVVGHLVNGSPRHASRAVQHLNASDVTIVQHEYGIFGGPDGSDVVALVEALTGPTIVVFHTVLEEPTTGQRRVLRRLVEAADVAVTMTFIPTTEETAVTGSVSAASTARRSAATVIFVLTLVW
jgi:hypothetical protein